ncbi:MAG: hypothetical protein EOO81_12980 [Oxalobacteraceae bacterium]|nr:MAG: hypothetical protein EOO81_12980 [Oxalobacteraceae bacterium]
MSAIPNNGIGQRCASHLNLTRSLADVWAEEAAKPKDPTTPRHMGRPAGPNLMAPRFAGDERYGADR